jgi:hypothetical protein
MVFYLITSAFKSVIKAPMFTNWLMGWLNIDIPSFSYKVSDLPFRDHEDIISIRNDRDFFGDYFDFFDNDEQRLSLCDLIAKEYREHIAELKENYPEDWLSQLLTVTIQPINRNDGEFSKVFETGSTKQDDLGMYLVGVVPLGQLKEAVQTPQCWVEDVECMTTVLSDDTLFGLPLP